METVVTSSFERWFGQLSERLVRFVPHCVTPNQVTIAAFVISIGGSVALLLAGQNPLWLLPAMVAILVHIIGDGIDGALARARRQTSARGLFLDQMLDNVAFIAMPLAIAFSGLAYLEILVFAMLLILLHAILIQYWMILLNKRVFPVIGPVDYELLVLGSVGLAFVWPGAVLTIGGFEFGWFDLFFGFGAALSVIDLVRSMFRLIRELDGA
jgi:phosphatidylglycerophosphate synthase